jgi:hypothetical protein
MAHFRGIIQGGRGSVSRLGHSFFHAHIASWEGAISVRLYIIRTGTGKAMTERDFAEVRIVPHYGAGTSHLLYDGPIDGKDFANGFSMSRAQIEECGRSYWRDTEEGPPNGE